MSEQLTAFHTGRGVCYLDVSEVVGVSAPVTGKGGFGESRRIILRGGGVEYILNTPENFAQLGPVLGKANPASWTPQAAPGGAFTPKISPTGPKRPKSARAGAGRRA
jgi:hypothetical protein